MPDDKIPPNAPPGQNPGTDRDTLLRPGEIWWRIGVDAYVAAIGEPPLARNVDSIELLRLLQTHDHDESRVHVRLVAGSLVISLASDVWAAIRDQVSR